MIGATIASFTNVGQHPGVLADPGSKRLSMKLHRTAASARTIHDGTSEIIRATILPRNAALLFADDQGAAVGLRRRIIFWIFRNIPSPTRIYGAEHIPSEVPMARLHGVFNDIVNFWCGSPSRPASSSAVFRTLNRMRHMILNCYRPAATAWEGR
jgi:hypothetical protein